MTDSELFELRRKMVEDLRALADNGGVNRTLVRQAANEIEALDEECAKRVSGQSIAFAQAMSNGEAAARLRSAVEAFLAKYDEVEPHIVDAFQLRQIHIGPYSGPHFGEELKALREALPSPPNAKAPGL